MPTRIAANARCTSEDAHMEPEINPAEPGVHRERCLGGYRDCSRTIAHLELSLAVWSKLHLATQAFLALRLNTRERRFAAASVLAASW